MPDPPLGTSAAAGTDFRLMNHGSVAVALAGKHPLLPIAPAEH